MPFLSAIYPLLCALALFTAGPGEKPVYGVKEVRDVVYGVAEGYWTEAPDNVWSSSGLVFRRSDSRRPLELKMDVYLPDGDDPGGERPLLLMMHGGAFFMGHKTEKAHVEWCRYFASLGYVAVSLNYRLGFCLDKPDITRAEEDAVEDAGNALHYLLGREEFRIDPQQVYLAGTSAGAFTALALAYGPGRQEGPYRIRAVANLWGYVHGLDILENARIPILSFQSEEDPVVPYREGFPLGAKLLTEKAFGTLAVYERAKELGIPCEHHPCPEKRHRLQTDDKGELTPRFYEIRDCMAAFFAACSPSGERSK